MGIEEEHPDVLQNIEFAVLLVRRQHPQMSDYVVLRAYEAILDSYAAEQVGREPREWHPTEVEQEVFDCVRDMCQARLGRRSMGEPEPGGEELQFDPIDVPTLVLCLKRLRKSVQTWTKRNGIQGYLNLIARFTP